MRLLRFREMFRAIIEAFEKLDMDKDIVTSLKASYILKPVITGEFKCFAITSNLFSLTLPLMLLSLLIADVFGLPKNEILILK